MGLNHQLLSTPSLMGHCRQNSVLHPQAAGQGPARLARAVEAGPRWRVTGCPILQQRFLRQKPLLDNSNLGQSVEERTIVTMAVLMDKYAASAVNQ